MELSAAKSEALLGIGDALAVLDLTHQLRDTVSRLHLQRGRLACAAKHASTACEAPVSGKGLGERKPGGCWMEARVGDGRALTHLGVHARKPAWRLDWVRATPRVSPLALFA